MLNQLIANGLENSYAIAAAMASAEQQLAAERTNYVTEIAALFGALGVEIGSEVARDYSVL